MKNEQTSENIVVYERANRHGKKPLWYAVCFIDFNDDIYNDE
jgi:hypothetical protein